MSNFKTDHITVNTQSSIRIVSASGTVIYADPLEIEGKPEDADLILITHSHYDHFSPADIAKIRKDSTKFVIPSSMKDEMEKNRIDMYSYLCMEPGDMINAAGIYVRAVPAYNKLKPFHPRRNGWIGYVLTVDGCEDLHSRRYGRPQGKHIYRVRYRYDPDRRHIYDESQGGGVLY